jgi:hypothetical protein
MIRIAEPHRISRVFTTDYHLFTPNKTTAQWKCSHDFVAHCFILWHETDPKKISSHVERVVVHEVSRVNLEVKIFSSGQGRVVAPPKKTPCLLASYIHRYRVFK